MYETGMRKQQIRAANKPSDATAASSDGSN